MGDDQRLNGSDLSRRFYVESVAPLLDTRFPGLRHAAGRLGTGSDVLGLDDAMSRDHDWGLRLELLVAAEACRSVRDFLDSSLPESFAGFPVVFAMTGSTQPRHRVEVSSAAEFVRARLGLDPRDGLSASDWLSFTGQAVLEVTAGSVFADTAGELTVIRDLLAWYPDDVWRYVVACDWRRLDQELPLIGRAGGRGDDFGSRVIATRLADVAMHLGFMLERRWAPYPKWTGTIFRQLPRASSIAPALEAVLSAGTWQDRQLELARVLDLLAEVQAEAGLPSSTPATIPFWDRPYIRVEPGLIDAVLGEVTDDSVRALLPGLGSIEQRSSNVNLLVDPRQRRSWTRT